MTYATAAQVSRIVSLAKAKGMTKVEALDAYGINPGEALTVYLASQVIDYLNASAVDIDQEAFLAAQTARDAVRAENEAADRAAMMERSAKVRAESEARFAEACRLADLEAAQ